MASVRLITTVDWERVAWLGQFVQHYQRLGVHAFHITVHFEPDVPVPCREHAMQMAEALTMYYGVAIDAALVCPYDAPTIRAWHDQLQAQKAKAADWIIWADIDEFHVYPTNLARMLHDADESQSLYLRGFLVDRVSRTGELVVFDPTRSIWSQYPRRTRLTETVAEAPIEKVVCSRAHLRLTPGNHFVVNDHLVRRYDTYVQVHHFKWDASVVARLQRRVQPTWQKRCPWWVESDRLLRHIEQHAGRVTVDLARERSVASRQCQPLGFQINGTRT